MFIQKLFLIPFFIFIFVNGIGHSKIYDCFIFFNELELLKVRFEELYDHVDKFVLVESVETFRANSKPLYFNENKHLFQKYSDKIIHVITERTSYPLSATWDREAYQRNQIIRALGDCQPDDIIMLSDVDEIVSGNELKRLIQPVINKSSPSIVCGQKLHGLYLNLLHRYEPWHGTVITSFESMKKLFDFNFETLRSKRLMYPIEENAGWHFTSMGGAQRFFYKVESCSTFVNDTPEFKTLKNVKKIIHNDYMMVPIDNSYPKFIQDNLSYFDEIGFIFHGEIK